MSIQSGWKDVELYIYDQLDRSEKQFGKIEKVLLELKVSVDKIRYQVMIGATVMATVFGAAIKWLVD